MSEQEFEFEADETPTISSKAFDEIKKLYCEPARLAGLPRPPVPTHVDLRGMTYMPLDVLRLRDSRMANHPNPEVFRSAVLLWCASWHQVPAGSLPNDDVELARFAGFGRDHQGWLAIREEALHGFVECSDARFYHRVVAEKALSAWGKKWDRPEKAQERSEHASKAAKSRWKKNKKPRARAMPEQCSTDAQPVPDPCLKGREEKGIEDKNSVLRTDAVASASPQPTYTDSRHELWGEGVPILRSLGVSESQSRSMIGKWLKGVKDDAQAVLSTIQKARDLRVQNPVPWITQGLQFGGQNVRSGSGLPGANRQGDGKSNGIQRALDSIIDRFAGEPDAGQQAHETSPRLLPNGRRQ